jgi:hypothetical protein
MTARVKCRFSRKKKRDTYFYACSPGDCDKKCLVVCIWEDIEKIDLDGKKYTVQSVKEVRCDCMQTPIWDADGSEDSDKCTLEIKRLNQETIDGKKYEKSVVRCSNQLCTEQCVFYIKYKDKNRELGEIESIGCRCIDFASL